MSGLFLYNLYYFPSLSFAPSTLLPEYPQLAFGQCLWREAMHQAIYHPAVPAVIN